MEFEWVYTLAPYLAVAILAIFIVVFLLMLYRAHSSPAPGLPLNKYKVNIRYNATYHKTIEGILVDSTDHFVGAGVWPPFIQLLQAAWARQVEAKKTTSGGNFQEITAFLGTLSAANFCRVVITRDGVLFSEKHILVVFGDPNRLLNSYASHEEDTEFNLSFGPVAKGVINGVGYTLPESFEFRNSRFNLGRGYTVHVFRPDDPQIPTHIGATKLAELVNTYTKKKEANPTVDFTLEIESELIKLGADPSWIKTDVDLARLVVIAPTSVDASEQLRAKDAIINNDHLQLDEMGIDLAQKADQLDRALRYAKGLQAEGSPQPNAATKKIDAIDMIAMIALPLIGFGVGITLSELLGGFIGHIVGVSCAVLLIYRRR